MGFMISTISLPGTNYTAHGQNGSTAKKFTMIFFQFSHCGHAEALLYVCCNRITFGYLPENGFIFTKMNSMECLVLFDIVFI